MTKLKFWKDEPRWWRTGDPEDLSTVSPSIDIEAEAARIALAVTTRPPDSRCQPIIAAELRRILKEGK